LSKCYREESPDEKKSLHIEDRRIDGVGGMLWFKARPILNLYMLIMKEDQTDEESR
jgi:hypothetical protein